MPELEAAPTTFAVPATEPAEPGSSPWRDAWYRLSKNRLALVGGCLIILFAFLCLIAGLIAPDPDFQDLALYASPPSHAHWFGTDALGRDLFSRVLHGGRISLAVGIVASMVALCIGVVYGTISGFYGGTVDAVMMRIVDILYALPFAIFVILLTVFFGSNLLLLFGAIGAVEWLTMARIVEAAEALGISRRRIIFRHMIPNVLGPVIVYTTLTIPSVMLLESFLSFLGLGVQPPNASWGVLIHEGALAMEEFPWLLIFPGLAFSITLFSFNFLGDGLRDALDPRAAKD